jgi:hypothetical protein
VQTRVVAELRPRKPLEPLLRLTPREIAQVHGEHLVYCFRLAVGLRVECRRQMELDAGHHEQLHLEFAGEDGSRSLTMELGIPCSRTMSLKKARAMDVTI